MIYNERTIQNALFHYLRGRGFWPIFPNMDCITKYEADVIALTKAGYAYEYEIKISLADFRADMKKRSKHASLSGAVKKIPSPYSWGKEREIYVFADAPEDPYRAIRNGTCYPKQRPKQFWYVISGFDIPDNEIPLYAGLKRYTPHGLQTIKDAPNLDARKVDAKIIQHAAENMLFRYWALRCQEPIETDAISSPLIEAL